jgi:hypothetical protein
MRRCFRPKAARSGICRFPVENPDAAAERVRGGAGFVRLRGAVCGGLHGRLDALPSGGGDALGGEYGQGHGVRSLGRLRQRSVKPNVPGSNGWLAGSSFPDRDLN